MVKVESELFKQQSEFDKERADLNQEIDDLRDEKFELEDKLDDSKLEIQQLKKKVEPLTVLRNDFRCLVCLRTCALPCIKAPCCDIIVGCQSCIIRWLETRSVCPHCRANLAAADCIAVPYIKQLADAIKDEPLFTSESTE